MHPAGDGEQALGQVRQLRPDLIITDGSMPKMDGFDLCRQLADDPTTATIPVLMITGSAGPDEVMRRLPFLPGAMRKPFQPSELARRVQALLGPRVPRRRNRSR